jgi:hypothetical protein
MATRATSRTAARTPGTVATQPGSSTAAARNLAGLELILNDAGIGEDRFARAAAIAIAELRTGAGPRVDEPATQFSQAEREILAAGGLDLTPRRARDPDPLTETAARFAALLADSEDVAAVAERLGVTRARVRQRALERSLFALREDDEWRFPRAQFADGAPIRGLPAVAIALPLDIHPVAAWRFLTEPSADLDIADHPTSPLDWLRSGGSPDPIVAIAREL